MDPYGTMYILTENPQNMEKWGIIQLDDKRKKPMDLSEQPARVDPSKYRLISSIKVRIVPLDDPNLRVYQWDNHKDISYLQTLYTILNTMFEEKTMYIYWLVHQPTIDLDVMY